MGRTLQILILEHDEYQKLVLADVNNYIGVNNFIDVDITKWREVKQSQPHYLFKVENDKFSFAPVSLKVGLTFITCNYIRISLS